MKKIKIKILGFWSGFDINNNFIIDKLKKHFEVELSDEPDYIISSCFTKEYLKYHDCVKIFYTGENICPDFNMFDYAIGFEKLAFGDRYIYFPNYLIPEIYGNDYACMLQKHCIKDDFLNSKSDFCSFVVSKGSGNVMSCREEIFHKLSNYKKVNSGGRYLNNIGEPDGVKDKLAFQSRHKFAIAFENSSHAGYTTEKLVQAFAAGTVPIYYGDPLVSETFNPDSFINCHDFDNFDKVVEIVRQIDSDDDLYLKMIKSPALKHKATMEEQNLRLEQFLMYIFEQPKKVAFRRDRIGYGKMYCDNLLSFYEQRLKSQNTIANRIKTKLRLLLV